MKNPKRIDRYCRDLAEIWHKAPDMRFGQLMVNLMSEVMGQTGRGIFYIEDNEMFERMKLISEEWIEQ